MSGPFRLALKYIAYNRFKSTILVGCIFLTALLPISVKLLLQQFNDKILARADSTPVVVGADGSKLDLTMHALYFKTQPPATVPFSEVQRIWETDLARAIPIHARFTAQRDYPIVGTSVDYFDFRELKLQSGSLFAMLGECVVGANVASDLGLSPGDQLLSDRENVINIAGLYPLKMNVVGVLQPNRTADDQAVFVDLKTAWIIQGLGHGHQDLATETDEGKILSRDDNRIVASAAVLPYTEITDSNLDSFHFHGDTQDFPITAIIVLGNDLKSETLLEGKYDVEETGFQFVRPPEVVRELMQTVFRVKLFFDANAMLVAVATVMLLVLVLTLSLRLRQREMQTMFKIGCTRSTIGWLQFWEIAMIFAAAAVLVLLAAWGIWRVSGNVVELLLLNSTA